VPSKPVPNWHDIGYSCFSCERVGPPAFEWLHALLAGVVEEIHLPFSCFNFLWFHLTYFYERYCAMLGNTFLAMSLFLPVSVVKAAANFFPLSHIPAPFRGEVRVEAFPKEQGLVPCRAMGATLALH